MRLDEGMFGVRRYTRDERRERGGGRDMSWDMSEGEKELESLR